MGCAALANPECSARQQRFQTLIALMLSSQTLDTVTAPTVRNMQRVLPHGLDLQDMLDISESDLDKLITKIGFHNKKAAYIKRVAVILRDKYGGDIPDTVEGLCSLPGVGEKMAHLCMTAAWKKYPPILSLRRANRQDGWRWSRYTCSSHCKSVEVGGCSNAREDESCFGGLVTDGVLGTYKSSARWIWTDNLSTKSAEMWGV
jgi:endonuclease-3